MVDRELAERHYDEHRDKPFFAELVDFVTRSRCVPMVAEGPDETTPLVRKLVGATKAVDAEPGSIRGDYGHMSPRRTWCRPSMAHGPPARSAGSPA